MVIVNVTVPFTAAGFGALLNPKSNGGGVSGVCPRVVAHKQNIANSNAANF
jgi:hypothetical protein